jgi:hypothetical protein
MALCYTHQGLGRMLTPLVPDDDCISEPVSGPLILAALHVTPIPMNGYPFGFGQDSASLCGGLELAGGGW